MLCFSLLLNTWLLFQTIVLGSNANRGKDIDNAEWAQRLSVGLLITGHTTSDNLEKMYSTTGDRLEKWIQWGLDAKGFDTLPRARASIKNEDTGQEELVDVMISYDITHYDAENGQLPESTDSHDIYFLSGSASSSVDGEPWMLKLEEFIRNVDKMATDPENSSKRTPVMVGICFGHQIIHKALGGQVISGALAYPLIGNETYDIYKDHPMMRYESEEDSLSPKISLDVLHDDQVLTLADGFEAYAGNASNPYGITIKANHILTYQAHPEYPNKNNLRYVRSIIEDIFANDNMDRESYEKLTKMIHYAPFPESVRASLWTNQFISDAMGTAGVVVAKTGLEDRSLSTGSVVNILTSYAKSYAKKLKSALAF